MWQKWYSPFLKLTRARLGCVAPLGRPSSVYKSNIECSFLGRNDGQMTLTVEVNDFHFQYQPRVSQDVYLVQIWSLQVIMQTNQISKNSKSKWPKWPWRSRSMTSISIPTEGIPGCMFGAYLVILAQICEELSHRQAEFPRILSQNGQNDLEGEGQWPPFSIPAESIPWFMFEANLVIPAQTCDELSCGKVKFMDGRLSVWTNPQHDASLDG